MVSTTRSFKLVRRPAGALSPGDVELVTSELPEVGDGQALVQTKVVSIDPTNRLWMSDMRTYMPPVELGTTMRALGVGEVIASRRSDLPVGAHVMGWTGWAEHVLADDAQLVSPFTVLPDPLPAPLEAFVGALGHTGITAWLGVELFGRPAAGETMVVSAAAGAVGSVAGQLAKARGVRVVGIAGGAEKCAHVVDELGFDACVDYKAEGWREAFDAAVPDGVDVDFENVGGEVMDHVLMRLNVGARVALCGMISQYNAAGAETDWAGQVNVGQLIMQRATMTGFLVLDHADRYADAVAELAGLLADGRLTYRESVVEGFERLPGTLNRLFTGMNTGKLLVRL